MPKAFYLALLVVITILTSIADTFVKKATIDEPVKYMTYAAILWIGFLVAWFFIYKNFTFTATGIIYSVIYLLTTVVMGITQFHETIRPTEAIGIVMAIISVFLLYRFV